MSILLVLGVTLLTFTAMEAWAWFSHKYLLHGPLWFLHKSHHSPRKGWWEANDWVSILYGLLASMAIVYGSQGYPVWLGLGIGIALYGFFYFVFHDVIIHRRIKIGYRARHPYVRRLIRAHKIHHKHQQKADSEAFGFLYASPKYAVKDWKATQKEHIHAKVGENTPT